MGREAVPPTLRYDNPVKKHLRPGEQLLWVGRPETGWTLRWRHPLLIIGLAWAGLTFEWIRRMVGAYLFPVGAPMSSAPPTRMMTVLVTLGTVLLAWHIWADRVRRLGTWYAVTDRRVLFVRQGVRPESAISYTFDEISGVLLNPRDEATTLPTRDKVVIRLKHSDAYAGLSGVLGYQLASNEIVLENLPDAKEFYELVHPRQLEAMKVDQTVFERIE
jgi:hypothetical protein